MSSSLAHIILGTLGGWLILASVPISVGLPVLWCHKLGDGCLASLVYGLSMFAMLGLCVYGAVSLIEAAS